MTQYIDPMWGAYATTNAIARSAGSRAGIIAAPTPTLGGTAGARTLTFTPEAGFWAWKTFWEIGNGSHVVIEDAVKTFSLGADPGSGNSVKILIVGRWKFEAGALSAGKPVAPHVRAASYEVVVGTADPSPSDPTYVQPDPTEGLGVTLARVTLTNGASPVFEWLPETMVDPVIIGGKIKELQDWINAPAFTVDGFTIVDSVTADVYRFQMVSGVLTQVVV